MSGWDTSYGNSTGLQAPSYETNLHNRGGMAQDPYYSNAHSIDVPVPMNNNYQPPTVPAQARPAGEKAAFSASGVVQGMDIGNWKNKENATNCSLCEAPFSTLSKRRVGGIVCYFVDVLDFNGYV